MVRNFRTQGPKPTASPSNFQEFGSNGPTISDLFPNIAQHAEKMCVINSMWQFDVPNHRSLPDVAYGRVPFCAAQHGVVALYGLGTQNQNLPGFVTIAPSPTWGGRNIILAGFLPAIYQGTGLINQVTGGATDWQYPLESLTGRFDAADRFTTITKSGHLVSKKQVNPELEGMIESYELAFRMQDALPTVLDFKEESKATLDMYGIGGGQTDNFGRQCLMARRLAESGVAYRN